MKEKFENLIAIYRKQEENHFMISYLQSEILPRIERDESIKDFLTEELEKLATYFRDTKLCSGNLAEYGFAFSKRLYLRDYLGISNIEK